MRSKQVIIYFVAGFVVLTVIGIVIGLMTSKPQPAPDILDTANNREYFANKADIIDGQPIMEPANLEPGTTVIDLQTRDRKIIPSNKPLPLLPAAASPLVRPETIQREGIMKNLYRESNVYYISNNDNNTSKPEYLKGLKN